MASLNQIVQSLVDTVNQSDNHNLKERLKLSFKHLLAERIRHDIEKNGNSFGYTVRTVLSLTQADSLLDCNIESGCTVLRTTNQIIKPIRIKGRVPFNYVGNGKVSYTYVSYRDILDFLHLKYIGKEIFWDLINNYIVIFNAKRLTSVIVEGYYTSMEVLNCGTNPCYTDDSEYPAPEDLIEGIKLQILKTELSIYQKPTEVTMNQESINNGGKG